MGYLWHVGNGKKVKFWEDNWVGPSSLAIMFWELYVIVNEKTATIADLWDGSKEDEHWEIMNQIWVSLSNMLKRWDVLYPEDVKEEVMGFVGSLKRRRWQESFCCLGIEGGKGFGTINVEPLGVQYSGSQCRYD
ncbi:hypothetical protein ACP70R_029378 [Stipagrostis hirtigluma subsp. patula]